MKLIFFIFLLFTLNAEARIFYVSNAGSDANSGLTTLLPWQTISKVNSATYNAGDTIAFKCGDTFVGGIIVNRNGGASTRMVYTSYGSGAKPIITGLATITGWVNLGGNIWEAPTVGVKAANNLVLKDNYPMGVGRYPNANAANAGYLTYTASSSTTITGPALSSVTNWTGAQVVIKFRRYDFAHQTVTNHVGGVVTFASFGYIPTPNFGYFFQRDPRTLDQDGEWYQNGSTSKLRMYFADNNPSGHLIQAVVYDSLMFTTYSNLYVSNLYFYGGGQYGFYAKSGPQNITIENCDFRNFGAEACSPISSSNVLVNNCNVTNAYGSGIRVYNNTGDNLTATNNYTDSISSVVGMELPTQSNNGGAGVLARGHNGVTMHHNVVKNCGYLAIEWQGNNVNVYNNFVDSFNITRDDGGGIYSLENPGAVLQYRSNRNIYNNIVLHGIGVSAGTDNTITSAKGIYFDEGTRNVNAYGNTVAYNSYYAYYGNNSDTILLHDNTSFNTTVSTSFQRFNTGTPIAPPMIGMNITRNIYSPYRFNWRDLAIDSPTVVTFVQDIQRMGVMDSNYYALRAGTDTSLTGFIRNYNTTGGATYNYPFSYITGTIGKETHSINFANTGRLEYNASDTVRQVLFIDTIFSEPNGTLDTNAVNIQPWSSKVLIFVKVNVRPIVSAGSNIVITQPLSGTPVTGTATDPDGSITAVLWSQLYGPSTATFTAATSLSTVINNLLNTGVYGFKLKATGNGGPQDTASATMTVTVNTATPPVNLPPVFSPAPIPSQTITLPTNSTTATAAATDPDGTVTGYRWYYLTGPAGSTITTATSTTPTFGSLTVGIFTYKVSAYDNSGDSSSTTFQITVNPAPILPPIPNAGADQTITLPTTATTLAGSGVAGSCAISSNTWTLISSPGGSSPVITTPSSYTSTFTNLLVAGTYVLRLTLTSGCTSPATDDVTITVLPVYVPPSSCNCFNTFTKFQN